MAADPDYDLPASLGSRPALRGSARPKPPTAEQLRAELEAQKETLMWRYGLVRCAAACCRGCVVLLRWLRRRVLPAGELPQHMLLVLLPAHLQLVACNACRHALTVRRPALPTHLAV